ARKKLSRAKVKKPAVVDPDLIWSLPDGEIRRYDSRLNIICRVPLLITPGLRQVRLAVSIVQVRDFIMYCAKW
ncbi:hypothetical protein ACTHIO_004173, partial [Escherichia coli]